MYNIFLYTIGYPFSMKKLKRARIDLRSNKFGDSIFVDIIEPGFIEVRIPHDMSIVKYLIRCLNVGLSYCEGPALYGHGVGSTGSRRVQSPGVSPYRRKGRPETKFS